MTRHLLLVLLTSTSAAESSEPAGIAMTPNTGHRLFQCRALAAAGGGPDAWVSIGWREIP